MSNLNELIIKEQDFEAMMASKVLPFVKERIKKEYVKVSDENRLAFEYLVNPDSQRSIVISHGYCEFTTKYYEVMYYLYNMGFSVFIVEHIGHGYSDRLVEGYSKVHVDRFERYVYDFNFFVKDGVKRIVPDDELILYGHSMGGAIAALYLEKFPAVFKKAILTSPMIDMYTGGSSKAAIMFVKALSYLPGFGKKYVPGHHDYDSEYKYLKSSSISKARYDYQYAERERDEHYRMNGASMSWTREAINVSKKILKNAKSVQIPVILFQASEDALVKPLAQNQFAELSGNTKLYVMQDSKHEIYNATDDIVADYYKKIFDFLS